jgi:hypothetical protein
MCADLSRTAWQLCVFTTFVRGARQRQLGGFGSETCCIGMTRTVATRRQRQLGGFGSETGCVGCVPGRRPEKRQRQLGGFASETSPRWAGDARRCSARQRQLGGFGSETIAPSVVRPSYVARQRQLGGFGSETQALGYQATALLERQRQLGGFGSETRMVRCAFTRLTRRQRQLGGFGSETQVFEHERQSGTRPATPARRFRFRDTARNMPSSERVTPAATPARRFRFRDTFSQRLPMRASPRQRQLGGFGSETLRLDAVGCLGRSRQRQQRNVATTARRFRFRDLHDVWLPKCHPERQRQLGGSGSETILGRAMTTSLHLRQRQLGGFGSETNPPRTQMPGTTGGNASSEVSVPRPGGEWYSRSEPSCGNASSEVSVPRHPRIARMPSPAPGGNASSEVSVPRLRCTAPGHRASDVAATPARRFRFRDYATVRPPRRRPAVRQRQLGGFGSETQGTSRLLFSGAERQRQLGGFGSETTSVRATPRRLFARQRQLGDFGSETFGPSGIASHARPAATPARRLRFRDEAGLVHLEAESEVATSARSFPFREERGLRGTGAFRRVATPARRPWFRDERDLLGRGSTAPWQQQLGGLGSETRQPVCRFCCEMPQCQLGGLGFETKGQLRSASSDGGVPRRVRDEPLPV